MILTFVVPEDTLCAVFSCVKGNTTGLTLYTKTLDSEDLAERSVIYVGNIEREEVVFNECQ